MEKGDLTSVLFVGSLLLCALGLVIKCWPGKQRVVIKSPDEHQGDTARSEIEKRFSNVFSMMPRARRESMINHYRSKYGCSRDAAMGIAIDHRSSDDQRWQ